MSGPSTSAGGLPPGDLAQLVNTQGKTTVYPSEDALVSALQARFRADEPYARVGWSTWVVVNPFKPLANTNDESARTYEEQCFRDTSLNTGPALQPHPYELAARMYLLMRRRGESQSVIFRGVTASGKTHTARLLTSQILRLSTRSKRDHKIAAQLTALGSLLDAFGCAKTFASPSGSRHGRWTELQFDSRGRVCGGQALTFGLDKSRLVKLRPEERTYHVFYQMLMGLAGQERERLGIDDLDVSDFALLASSGCYRLPSGSSLGDDSAAWSETRSAMDVLGIKPKSQFAIASLLLAVLLLGNIVFTDPPALGEPARVANMPVLERVAQLLGVNSEDLALGLATRVGYVRRDALSTHLDAAGARAHTDALASDLYAILFAYVVEAGNRRCAPNEGVAQTQIVLVDVPGFQSRTPNGSNTSGSGNGLSIASMGMPLVSQHGANGFDEFAVNFADEVVQAYTVRRIFDDTAPGIGAAGELQVDGVHLPEVTTMDNSACAELLRGPPGSVKAAGISGSISRASNAWRVGKGPAAGKTGAEAAEDEGVALVQDLVAQFGTHGNFISSPNVSLATQPGSRQSMLSLSGASTFGGFGAGGADARAMFGINHWAGAVSYDARGFSMKDADIVDPGLVTLLRASGDPFVMKLLVGPGMAAETHSRDKATLVQCQVSSRPLRLPTPILSPEGAPPSPDDSYAELDPGKVFSVCTQLGTAISELLRTLDRTRSWNVLCIKPNESGVGNSFDKRRVKTQVRSLLLPDVIKRRRPGTDWCVRMPIADFSDRYGRTPSEFGWRDGSEYISGTGSAIWMTYESWKSVEDAIRALEKDAKADAISEYNPDDDDQSQSHFGHSRGPSAAFGMPVGKNPFASQSSVGHGYDNYGGGGQEVRSPGLPHDGSSWRSPSEFAGQEYESKERLEPDDHEMPVTVKEVQNTVEEVPTSTSRRWWVRFVWLCTWWIPSAALKYIGRMKRPDVQMAWREKVAICMIIFFLCGIVIFFILFFGKLLCPNFDKGWSINEVGQHTGDDDFWVAVQGEVYDLTNFWRSSHSQNPALPVNGASMKELVGQDLTNYFPIPLTKSCPDLVTDTSVFLEHANWTAINPLAIHTSGPLQGASPTELNDIDWYTKFFLPKMKGFHKGPLLITRGNVRNEAQSQDDGVTSGKQWAIFEGGVYDLSDYFYTANRHVNDDKYSFLNKLITDLWKQQPGTDITKAIKETMKQNDISDTDWRRQFACLRNNFYVGEADFRKSARCQVTNYVLIVAAAIIMATILIKFLAALQLGGKRNPELQDKFVICQVPCYTEGEESLRRTIDSLASLKYDDKRKLIFLICDGNIIGSGNDRPTPRIALDILGVDPKLDPEPLLFRSIGEGSKQLNYGKVYSGLYEFDGHVVPYVVVVKTGKPSERSRPGNRGKRDSQILLMHYLNRVHFDAPMSPLELEIYHQMRNVIGIDPAFYEYIFMVDADTLVTPDSLNRLVAVTSDDAQVIAVCGETKLYNEEGSWWTMIQVYEYYISHHLAKAFESLFGSVTCLPGCFSMYRIRTADKGRPLIISNRVIDDYSECIVDTLHKKNLLSLGEDRYLTTIMMKHFPTFKMKFTPDAICHTVAPDRFSILLSQRRRWINSTIHNLVELVFLPELCGFCLFSMRFIVFLDLMGTIILPATAVYLVWLIVTVATGNAPIPYISLAMIAAVYGFQVIIFILKREFMLVGWLIIYILAYPVYSFFLPIYSFWCMDDFSWGNTRVVVGEGNNKKVVIADDEKFDESMIPLKKFSDYEAEAWETGSVHSGSRSPNTEHPRSQSVDPYRKQPSPSRGPSRQSFNPASQAGDYYRDTNMTQTGASNRGMAARNTMMGAAPLNTNVGYYGSRPGSAAGLHPSSAGGLLGMNLPGGSATSLHMPFMSPFGPPSAPGSDYGGAGGPQSAFMSPVGYPGPVPSVYGMPAASMNPFGARPLSTFSLATTVNPFAGAAAGAAAVTPSQNPKPSDEELVAALRSYLSTQDLMSVTKKTTREALSARFPKAELTSRKDFINESIDRILSEA